MPYVAFIAVRTARQFRLSLGSIFVPPASLAHQTAEQSPFGAPDDHQDGMQPPSSPQYLFSIYAPWQVSLHSELLIPETHEHRLSTHVIGQPRPPRRLQLHRKVTVTSS